MVNVTAPHAILQRTTSSRGTSSRSPCLVCPADETVAVPSKAQIDAVRSRNYLYLVMAFHRHRPRDVAQVFMQHNLNFATAYETLVTARAAGSPFRHGLPYSFAQQRPTTALHARALPRELQKWWGEPRPSERALSQEEVGLLVPRARALVDCVADRDPARRKDRFEQMWNGTYVGFRHFQRELGMLRDDLYQRRYTSTAGVNVAGLGPELNKTLVSSAETWCSVWGELDLHAVEWKNAPLLIHKYVMMTQWVELRIVAGQREHGGYDHQSRGTMFHLLHRFFGKRDEAARFTSPDLISAMVEEVRTKIRDEQVNCVFYMNGSSVQLSRISYEGRTSN